MIYERKDMLLMKRPPSKRLPMDRKRRAKQFAPFQALKGFAHSISETETLYVEKKKQSDAVRLEMDRMIKALPDGVAVTVVFFQESEKHPGLGMYLPVTGVPKIIEHEKVMEIAGIRIPIDDIAEMIRDEEEI